ncbi:MAG TPA: peptide chain release factor 2 [Oscillospiraceae bacterium]|nr:peptide chain release factor 2 [Oscillospiraceae bacterium]HPS33641.1 peptide chain release factor 2 [Oscillospiraceae bacterium]
MLQYEEILLLLRNKKPELTEYLEAVRYEKLKAELAELEQQTHDEKYWSDVAGLQVLMKKIGGIKSKLASCDKLKNDYEDCVALAQICNETEDLSMLDEVKAAVEAYEKKLEEKKLTLLLSGKYDNSNAILTFHPGAGGTESNDWAQMLYRMYTRWTERHGYKYQILDYQDGEEAGIKSASILITGENVFGYLKSESGVHRLVRCSPFDASGRRHTSFAAIEVVPEISDDLDVEIRDEDLKVDTYRSSGAGGQHVNKTESAIRITHIPTGIVVSCQTERSQYQNRDTAMKMLRSKLVDIAEKQHLENIADIKGVQKEIAWGSQIRSYVFMPYTMVKDHRTDFEMGNINAVMDGELDGFITAYLKMKVSQN